MIAQLCSLRVKTLSPGQNVNTYVPGPQTHFQGPQVCWDADWDSWTHQTCVEKLHATRM